MVSEVAEGAGLDPEGDPDDRALSERLAAELVDVGYASAEAGSNGFLIITPEGEQALRGGARRNDSPRLSPRNPIGWLFCATGLSHGVLHFSTQHSRYALLEVPGSVPAFSSRESQGIDEPVMETLGRGSGHRCGDGIAVALR
jgi:hypothetical protein